MNGFHLYQLVKINGMTDWKLLNMKPSANWEHGEQTDVPLFVDPDVIMSSGQDYESQALSRVELANVPPKITQSRANHNNGNKSHTLSDVVAHRRKAERRLTDGFRRRKDV